MPGGGKFDGQLPEGFAPGQMLQGFDPSQMQGGQRPDGFAGGQMPGGGKFDGQMPQGNLGINLENAPAQIEFYMQDKVNAFSGVADIEVK